MGAWRYWELYVTATAGGQAGIDLNEVEMRIAGVNQVGSGTPSASSFFSGLPPANAFDGNLTNRFATDFSGTWPQWLRYDFGAGNEKAIDEFRIMPDGTSRAPGTFAIRFSNDGVLWGEAHSETGLTTGWTAKAFRSFTFVPPDEIPSSPIHITQVPILVVDLTNQPVHITQIPLLAISLPFQPARVTQVPILVPNHPVPVPLPLPVIPEIPVREIWRYKTVVNLSEKAKEQRSSLRPEPRVGLSFTSLILDDEDYQHVYEMLLKYVKQAIFYPNYVYSTKLQAPVEAGDTKVYFDPSMTDVRAGEPLAFVNPQTYETLFSLTIDQDNLKPRVTTISSVDSDGITLSEPLSFDAPEQWYVCPVGEFRIDTRPGFAMNSVDGEVAVNLESVNVREVLRPDEDVVLPTIDDIIILDKRPLANSAVQETFDQNVTWLDDDTGPAEPRTLWTTAYVSGNREFLAHRPQDIDYWRKFADTVRGRWKPFILSTYRDDLPLIEVPALNATVLVSSNIQFFDFWRSPAYRYLRIESEAGYIYRRILEVKMNYDSEGLPESTNVRLSQGIGSSAGSNQISKVSFANLCRLDSDDIILEHHDLDTLVRIAVRSIDR